jgi:guanylate kinase
MLGTLFLISGPSAVGKTTLAELLMQELADEPIKLLVTYTTKKPRLGDVEGKDYFFIDERDFVNKKQEGFFMESAFVYGNWYGVPVSILSDLQNGISYIAVVDVKGAQTLSSLYSRHLAVWIDADQDIIMERMKLRGTESQDVQNIRLGELQKERRLALDSQLFSYTLINNDKENALKEFKSLIRSYIRES